MSIRNKELEQMFQLEGGKMKKSSRKLSKKTSKKMGKKTSKKMSRKSSRKSCNMCRSGKTCKKHY
jgi:hypothetical protein